MSYNWGIDIKCPFSEEKRDLSGERLTIVLDKGLGLSQLKDLLQLAGQYIDFIKFSFGTSFLYNRNLLQSKIEIIKKQGIDVFPGGTLFEIAFNQKKSKDYFFRAHQLGFTAIEISAGITEFQAQKRKKTIQQASALGLKVLTEVGKKDRNRALKISDFIDQIKKNFAWGSDFVIIEGRESGKDVSIFNKKGGVDRRKLETINDQIRQNKNDLIWEAPLKKQQVFFITQFGPEVNLGNIKPQDILAVECLRRGLRGDTFNYTQKNRPK